MMNDVRVCGRSDLNRVAVGKRRSDAAMDVVMEMATEVKPIAVETTGTTI